MSGSCATSCCRVGPDARYGESGTVARATSWTRSYATGSNGGYDGPDGTGSGNSNATESSREAAAEGEAHSAHEA